MEHIVYCDTKAKELDKILDGSKTMIIRGATGRKLPYGRVFEEENLYFIENNGSGIIKTKAIVKSVLNSDKLTEEESKKLINKNLNKLNLTVTQIKRWSGKRFLCLIEFKDVKNINPVTLNHQDNMDDWITVEDINSITNESNVKYQSMRLE